MRRFAEAGIALEPRSIGRCVDLAFRFMRQEWKPVLAIAAACMVPAAAATYATAVATDYGWLAAVGSVSFMSVLLGSLLVTYAAAVAFREPVSMLRVCEIGLWRVAPVLIAKCFLRVLAVGLSFLIIPAPLLLTYAGFMTESRVLKQFRSRRYEHRTQELVQREFSDLLIRAGLLMSFGMLLWLVCLMTVDALSKLLLDVSPVFGPLGEAGQDPWGYLEPEDVFGNMLAAAFTDPSVLTTVVVTALGTYVVLRLAWFFSYIDLRIRLDCWDLEVALADEARRWEASP